MTHHYNTHLLRVPQDSPSLSCAAPMMMVYMLLLAAVGAPSTRVSQHTGVWSAPPAMCGPDSALERGNTGAYHARTHSFHRSGGLPVVVGVVLDCWGAKTHAVEPPAPTHTFLLWIGGRGPTKAFFVSVLLSVQAKIFIVSFMRDFQHLL